MRTIMGISRSPLHGSIEMTLHWGWESKPLAKL